MTDSRWSRSIGFRTMMRLSLHGGLPERTAVQQEQDNGKINGLGLR